MTIAVSVTHAILSSDLEEYLLLFCSHSGARQNIHFPRKYSDGSENCHHLPKLQAEASTHMILCRNPKHNDSSVIFLKPASHRGKIKNLTRPNLHLRITIQSFVSRH